MPDVLLLLSAVLGFATRMLGLTVKEAWVLGSVFVPASILYGEFVLPYQGGGASMWPIALVFGGGMGAAASGVGVFVASRFLPKAPDGER